MPRRKRPTPPITEIIVGKIALRLWPHDTSANIAVVNVSVSGATTARRPACAPSAIRYRYREGIHRSKG
jgi:hypothetical protein